MFNQLESRLGFPWTIRSIAFLFLALQVVAIATVRSRIEHRPRSFNPRALCKHFNDLAFMLNAAGCFFSFWGMVLPGTFMILNAEQKGMSARLAGYLLSIFNGVGYTMIHWHCECSLTDLQLSGPPRTTIYRRQAWPLQHDDRSGFLQLCT